MATRRSTRGSGASTESATRDEISEPSSTSSFEAARHLPLAEGALGDVPLRVHARYQREEILAALDFAIDGRSRTASARAFWYSADRNVDAFFITLRSPRRTTPRPRCTGTTRSARRSSTGSRSRRRRSHSPTGQRYLNGTSTVLLFVRHEQKDEFGTSPYLFLGPAHYVSHQAIDRSPSLGG